MMGLMDYNRLVVDVVDDVAVDVNKFFVDAYAFDRVLIIIVYSY